MRVFCYVVLGAVCSLVLPFRAAAAVQLPNLFSDHAVVQRDRPVRIWGSGQAGEMVALRFHDQTVTAQTDSYGNWEAWLKPEPAGGPYTLEVSSNIKRPRRSSAKIFWSATCGWLQASRTWSFLPGRFLPGPFPAPLKDGEKEIAAANHPRIRLLSAEKGNLHGSAKRSFGRVDGMHAGYGSSLFRCCLLFWAGDLGTGNDSGWAD